MGDFREMVRQTAGPDFADKALKEFDNGLKELLGEQGFEGLDINRPMGTYVVVRDDIQDTSAVVVVPITGEKEFIGLLGRMKLKTEAVKDKPGTYTLQLPEHIVFPKASMVHIAGDLGSRLPQRRRRGGCQGPHSTRNTDRQRRPRAHHGQTLSRSRSR